MHEHMIVRFWKTFQILKRCSYYGTFNEERGIWKWPEFLWLSMIKRPNRRRSNILRDTHMIRAFLTFTRYLTDFHLIFFNVKLITCKNDKAASKLINKTKHDVLAQFPLTRLNVSSLVIQTKQTLKMLKFLHQPKSI